MASRYFATLLITLNKTVTQFRTTPLDRVPVNLNCYTVTVFVFLQRFSIGELFLVFMLLQE